MPLHPTLHSFAYALDYLADLVADVPDASMTAQPPGVVNHPAWTIGHLTHTCQLLAGVVGLPPWLPDDWPERYGAGSRPTPDPVHYPLKSQALATLRDAQSRLTRAVEPLDDATLDQPFPDPHYLDVFPTLRHALTQILVAHTALHVGQLTVWRRAMHLPPMARSFE